MNSTFVIDYSSRLRYASLIVLKEMHEETYQFQENLEGHEKVLEPIIHWLIKKKYITLNEDRLYRTTTQGSAFLWSFWDRYNAFLSQYDIYCGVDIETGDFAFRYFEDYADLDAWYEFLDDERWDDLRIAIAEYKGLDSLEIVFMSLVVDKRFGRDGEEWHYDLLFGSVWDEIQLICNNSIRYKTLMQETRGHASCIGDSHFLDNMIQAGEMLISNLRKSGYLGQFSRRL